MQGVDAAFPELWLPADSDALKALKLTIQTSAAVADHVVDLPFCAVQTNTNMTEMSVPKMTTDAGRCVENGLQMMFRRPCSVEL